MKIHKNVSLWKKTRKNYGVRRAAAGRARLRGKTYGTYLTREWKWYIIGYSGELSELAKIQMKV